MRAEQIQELLLRQPFVPFRLHLTDGSSYEIRHPDMVFLTRYSIEIGTPVREGSRIFQQVNYCALIHVVRAEILDAQAGAPA
jgi:hypothetical protein